MSLFDGFLDKMKLGNGDDEDDDDMYEDEMEEDTEDEPHVRRRSNRDEVFKGSNDNDEEDEPVIHKAKPVRSTTREKAAPKTASKIVRLNNSSSMEVCVIKPNSYEDGREIVSTLLDGKAVILNLEGIDVDLAQRISDFASGACFAIDGNLQRISSYIFIVTPRTVDVSGDFQSYITNSDTFNPTGY